MLKMAALLVAIAALVLSSQARAQGGCEAVLANGVFERQEYRNSEFGHLVLAARLSRMSEQGARDTLGHEGNVSVGFIKIGPGTWSSDKFKEFKDQMEKTYNVDQILAHESSVLLSSGDSKIISAWTECLTRGARVAR